MWGIEWGEQGAYLTARLCSPMNRNKPAKTLVGVKPRTSCRGGDMKARMAAEWRKGLQRCSWTRRTSREAGSSAPVVMSIISSFSMCNKLSECKGA